MKDLTGDFEWGTDYETLLDSMEIERVVEVWEQDYQGSTWVIVLDNDGRYGYLCFGWGSCSGCDAAQAVRNLQEATEIRDMIFNQIHWENSKEALREWFDARDWQGMWEWHDADFQRFYTEAKAYLAS